MILRNHSYGGWRIARLAALVAASAVGGAWLVSTDTSARGQAQFDNGALRGAYALVGNGGANEAASVGVTRFDGAGGATRVLTLNEADPNSSSRLILTIPATGNYTVNADGTGAAIFTNELPDGSKLPFTFDFVIGGAREPAETIAACCQAAHGAARARHRRQACGFRSQPVGGLSREGRGRPK